MRTKSNLLLRVYLWLLFGRTCTLSPHIWATQQKVRVELTNQSRGPEEGLPCCPAPINLRTTLTEGLAVHSGRALLLS